MAYDFSIESSAELIHNSRTKEYFKEVYQTYANGNYRSSIVMLYSVLICDLVYKLRDLRDLYRDSKAKKILEEIEALQALNSKSPEWETKLIDLIETRTTLLEASDVVAIKSLQNFRHLSAHPVLTNADLLFSPNKETTQSLIRNILEGILTSPPYFSNKIFDSLLSDLSDIKDKIIDDEQALDTYLTSRYLKQIKELDFQKLFRSLWKVAFITDDEQSRTNRKINFRALRIFFSHRRKTCVDLIKAEPSYYSNITKDTPLFNLCILLAKFYEIYPVLDKSLLLLIDKQIEHDDESRLISWFKYGDLKKHFSSLDPKTFSTISNPSFKFIREICKGNSLEALAIEFVVKFFAESKTYDETKARFNENIKPILGDLTKEQAELLLNVSENNASIRNRYGISTDLNHFINQRFPSDIDKTKYPRLFPLITSTQQASQTDSPND